jgi:hypothetical protein
MSNALAISAVTMTLKELVEKGLQVDDSSFRVTTLPPDKARDDVAERPNRINLFLYQAALNPAWRNMDMPRQTRPGETGSPPLALNLYYILTAYSENDDASKSHQFLGQAMSLLHDHCLLGRKKLEDIAPASRVHEQIERIRINLQPLSLEEISKLWTTFQTPYRISAAYEVSVVLIESTLPTRTPMPVLARGQDDTGARTLPGGSPLLIETRVPLSGKFVTSDETPTSQEIQLTKALPSAQLGDELALIGQGFTGDSVRVVLEHQWTGETIEPDILKRSGEVIIVKLPAPGDPVAATLVAGFYLVKVIAQNTGDPERYSNSLAVALAPKIMQINGQNLPALPAPLISVDRDDITQALSDVTLIITGSPDVLHEQTAMLLLGDRAIAAESRSENTDPLKFVSKQIAAGTYRLRLRVDGVDSHLIDRNNLDQPKFDDSQQVIIK